jgi:aspartyl protease family protein
MFCAWAIVGASNATEIVVQGLFKDMAILLVDGKQRTVRVGKSTPEGVKLLEADSEAAVLEYRGQRQRHVLGGSVQMSFDSPEQALAQIWPDQGMYYANGFINGQAVRFLVDTGASWVAMNARHARRLGVDFRYRGERATVRTASGVEPVYVVKLKTVRVGNIELRNVDAAVLDGDSPTEVLLGMSFLNRVDMKRQGEMLELRQKW